jgi:hypothetical protein
MPRAARSFKVIAMNTINPCYLQGASGLLRPPVLSAQCNASNIIGRQRYVLLGNPTTSKNVNQAMKPKELKQND